MSLDSIIAKQRAHAPVLAQKPLKYRLQKLAELRKALKGPWQEKLIAAMKADFSKGDVDVRLTEILPTLDNIKIVSKNLKNWTKPKKVKTPIILLALPHTPKSNPKEMY